MIGTVGGRVRQMRRRLNLTQTQLADNAGINVETVRAIEQNRGDRTQLATLHRLATALHVPASVLLGEQPPPVHWPLADIFWRQVAREIDQHRQATS